MFNRSNDFVDDGFGFNAETLKYENLMESGIVDPVKVVRSSLQNAASALSKKCENLSTDTSIINSYTTGTIVYRGDKFYYLPLYFSGGNLFKTVY